MEIPLRPGSSAKKGILAVLVICVPIILITYHITYHQASVVKDLFRKETSTPKRQVISHKEGDPNDQESIYSERVRTMNDYCDTLNQQTLQKLLHGEEPRLYVDDKHKFIFCTIAKVASSNWKRLILGLAGAEYALGPNAGSVHGDHEFKDMKLSELRKLELFQYSPKEIEYRLKHYTKAILVRHPLERTLSAYRSKFENVSSSHSKLQKIYRPMILRKYHPKLPEKAIRKGARVTFQDFVHYITHPSDFPELEPRDHMNNHWKTYITSCDPCSVRYDIVAKYETLDEDVSFILNKINASDHLARWPKRSEYYKAIPTSQVLSEELKHISSDDLKGLNAIYYHDYRMFGYEFREK